MTEYEISIIFHYDGEFVFDIICPVYNGGRQKMRSLPKTLTYDMLLNEAIALSNLDPSIEDVSMKYLHHNGLVFSLISLEDENDMLGMLMASGSEQDGLHVYVNRKLHVVNKKREGSRERVKVGGSSARKKMCKGICEIKNLTPGLVFPTVDIRENVDMHFSTALDPHVIDRSIRAGFHVDGIDPKAVDAHDAVCATVDILMVRGTLFWMMDGNKQGAETNHAVNHSFDMEDVNFVGNEQGAKTIHAMNHSFTMEDVNFRGNEQGAEAIHVVSHSLAMEDVNFVDKELHMTNPGTVTNINTTVEDRFRRFFWAFGRCIRSFCSSLRPMIAVDGSHLRGKYPGVLLVAVTYDGNHKLFPIAFALAEAECRDSWEWFLANLSLALGSPTNLTIVSVRQKGLVPALANIIPCAMHCYCIHHIAKNIKTTFCDRAIVLKFWRAANAFRPCEYEAYMNDILSVDQGAHIYINAIGKQHWSNVFVEGRRYDMITSNAAKCTTLF